MKHRFPILFLMAVLCIFSACGHANVPAEEDASKISFEEPTTSGDDYTFQRANYSKRFVGGTGFDHEGEIYYYVYSGEDEMEIDVQIHNGDVAFECGLGLVLDGVFQPFSILAEGGERTETAIAHTVQIEKNEVWEAALFFTPTTGKAGHEYNLAIATMQDPSFSADYVGLEKYALFPVHSFDAGSGMRLRMDADAPTSATAAVVQVEKTEIPQAYKDWVLGGVAEEEKDDEWAAITFAGLQKVGEIFDRGIDLIHFADGEEPNLYLDVCGKETDYRCYLFINHQIRELSPGCPFFEFSTNTKEVTRVRFTIDRTDLGAENHIYAILFEKSKGDAMTPAGSYIFSAKTDTAHLVFGPLPDVKEPESTVPAEPAPAARTALPAATGEILDLPDSGSGYATLKMTAEGLLCAVDLRMGKKAVAYDPQNDKVVSEFPLSENTLLCRIVGDRLITVDNPASENAAARIYDLNGNCLKTIPFTEESDLSPADRRLLEQELSGYSPDKSISASMMLSVDGTKLIYLACDYSKDEGVKPGTAYLVDLEIGERQKLSDARIGQHFRNLEFFRQNDFIGADYYENKTVYSLFALDGGTRKTWEFPVRNKSTKTLFSATDDVILFCDSDTPSGMITSVDLRNFSEREFPCQTSNEGRWAKLSADGKWLLTYDRHDPDNGWNDFRVYDFETGECVKGFSVPDAVGEWSETSAFLDEQNLVVYVQCREVGGNSDGTDRCYIRAISFED